MKSIRKGAFGVVLMSAGTILAFLSMVNPARTAPLSTELTSPSRMRIAQRETSGLAKLRMVPRIFRRVVCIPGSMVRRVRARLRFWPLEEMWSAR